MLKYNERMAALGPGASTKQYRKYSSLAIDKFDNQYYLIGSDVFNLSAGGKKLTDEEVNTLPVIICYLGTDVKYSDDEREAYTLLLKIISNINKLQVSSDFMSFPFGKIFNVICLDSKGAIKESE